jgi:hypothetical protein
MRYELSDYAWGDIDLMPPNRPRAIPRRDQMNSHKHAPLTPKGREAMVRCVTEAGLSKPAAARQFNTT